MGFAKEFKTFAMRGNVIDMAVGIVIGGAFGKIVSSLVTDVIMPPIGLLLSNVDFNHLSVTLKDAVGEQPAVTINYGLFINQIINFVIVALSIFLVIHLLSRLKRKEQAKPAAQAALPPQEVLLTEIRDILKSRA
jgi:large conductance mechanosensitive channel